MESPTCACLWPNDNTPAGISTSQGSRIAGSEQVAVAAALFEGRQTHPQGCSGVYFWPGERSMKKRLSPEFTLFHENLEPRSTPRTAAKIANWIACLIRCREV